jgi:gliding motility-associated lipoprotein GldH
MIFNFLPFNNINVKWVGFTFNKSKLGICSLLLFVLIGCDKYRVYETNIDFKERTWYADSVKSYNFSIEDTSLKYNVLYNVRNTVDYGFYNLYIKYELWGVDGKLISSDLHEVQLMDAKTGEPFGSGLGDIFDNRFYALKNLKFNKTGSYTIKIKQYMRKDPLNEILSFGIRLEKAEKQ